VPKGDIRIAAIFLFDHLVGAGDYPRGILRPGDYRAHSVIFEAGVTVHQWRPSEWVIKLDCIVIDQIPPRTIATSPECFLTPFLSPKGRYRGSGGNEQPNGRSIKRSGGHRLQISGYHGRPA
jgi:hypothetical protein